jgi:integrase
MVALRERNDLSAKTLEIIILTATRTGEAIGASWSGIDLDSAVWTIPANQMKAGIEHRVPLSRVTLTRLRDLPRIKDNEHVSPGQKPKRPLSNMACLTLLKRMERMERKDITVHGFRSTFRDRTAEQTSFPREVTEPALALTLKDKAAYQHGDLFEKRRKMMEA